MDLHETNQLPTEKQIEDEARSGTNFLSRMFPVASAEVKYVSLNCAIYFSLTFVYSLLKITKNAAMADALDSSAIQYIKIFVILPFNIFFVAKAQKLVAKTTMSRAFDVVVLTFSFLFLIYGLSFMFLPGLYERFVITKWWAMDIFADRKAGFKGFDWCYAVFSMINFPYIIFYYVFAELHGSLILNYVFWGVSNEFFTRAQSLRFSPFVIIAANVALFLSEPAISIINTISSKSNYFWNRIISMVVLMLCAVFNTVGWGVKKYGEKNIFNVPIFRSEAKKEAPKSKAKISLSDAVSILWKSTFVLSMSLCVLSYSVIQNFIEMFANRTAQTYGESVGDVKTTMQSFEGKSATATSLITIGLCFIPSHAIINAGYFSVYALSGAIITLFSVVGFLGFVTLNKFYFYRYGMTYAPLLLKNGDNVKYLECLLGCIARTVQKIIKYAVFDIFKETISMRLAPFYRAVFKGVYDGQINKVGKALGSLIGLFLNAWFDSKDITTAAIPVFAGMVVANLAWFVPSIYLVRLFRKSVNKNTDIGPGWRGKPLF